MKKILFALCATVTLAVLSGDAFAQTRRDNRVIQPGTALRPEWVVQDHGRCFDPTDAARLRRYAGVPCARGADPDPFIRSQLTRDRDYGDGGDDPQ